MECSTFQPACFEWWTAATRSPSDARTILSLSSSSYCTRVAMDENRTTSSVRKLRDGDEINLPEFVEGCCDQSQILLSEGLLS